MPDGHGMDPLREDVGRLRGDFHDEEGKTISFFHLDIINSDRYACCATAVASPCRLVFDRAPRRHDVRAERVHPVPVGHRPNERSRGLLAFTGPGGLPRTHGRDRTPGARDISKKLHTISQIALFSIGRSRHRRVPERCPAGRSILSHAKGAPQLLLCLRPRLAAPVVRSRCGGAPLVAVASPGSDRTAIAPGCALGHHHRRVWVWGQSAATGPPCLGRLTARPCVQIGAPEARSGPWACLIFLTAYNLNIQAR